MRRRYWIMVGAVAVAVAAAGSAVAATRFESPAARSKAVISDAAGRLHVTPGALSSALKQALDDQVDAAVAAGRLTKSQGDALKTRINAGRVPLVGGFGYGFGLGFRGRGFGPGFGFGFPLGHPGGMLGAGLRAVTSYLGVTQAELQSGLASGKSLAQIAKDHGKTAEGLIAVLVATAKTRLDRAVTAKHLSSAQEQAILSKLRGLFESLVNHTPPALPHSGLQHGFGFGFHNGHQSSWGKHGPSWSSPAPAPQL
jgi:hypothetical protein